MSGRIFHCVWRRSIKAQIIGMDVDERHSAVPGNPVEFLQPDVQPSAPCSNKKSVKS